MNCSLFSRAILSVTFSLAAASADQETEQGAAAPVAPPVADSGATPQKEKLTHGKKGPEFCFHKMEKKDRQRLVYFHHLIMEKYDLNKNGRLEPEEMKSLEADARKFREARHRMILSKYDKDGDGKLNEEETEALRADVRADMEKRLTRAERIRKPAAAKEGKDGDRSEETGMLPPPPRLEKPEPGPHRGKGGPGKGVPMKRLRPGPEGLIFVHGHHLMMEKFDRDGDGKLSPEERREMKKDRAAFSKKWEEIRKKAKEENKPDPEDGPSDMGIPAPADMPPPGKE